MGSLPDGEVFEPYPTVRPVEFGRIFWTGWDRPPRHLTGERDVWVVPDVEAGVLAGEDGGT